MHSIHGNANVSFWVPDSIVCLWHWNRLVSIVSKKRKEEVKNNDLKKKRKKERVEVMTTSKEQDLGASAGTSIRTLTK